MRNMIDVKVWDQGTWNRVKIHDDGTWNSAHIIVQPGCLCCDPAAPGRGSSEGVVVPPHLVLHDGEEVEGVLISGIPEATKPFNGAPIVLFKGRRYTARTGPNSFD